MIGVCPVYMGYTVIGTTVWGMSAEQFGDIQSSSMTLFALLNGDMVHDTFVNLQTARPKLAFWGQIYMYSFLSLFIYGVLNLVLSIITEEYEASYSFLREKEDEVDPISPMSVC